MSSLGRIESRHHGSIPSPSSRCDAERNVAISTTIIPISIIAPSSGYAKVPARAKRTTEEPKATPAPVPSRTIPLLVLRHSPSVIDCATISIRFAICLASETGHCVLTQLFFVLFWAEGAEGFNNNKLFPTPTTTHHPRAMRVFLFKFEFYNTGPT